MSVVDSKGRFIGLCVLGFFCPPIAVYLEFGSGEELIANLLFWFFIPFGGFVHAVYVLNKKRKSGHSSRPYDPESKGGYSGGRYNNGGYNGGHNGSHNGGGQINAGQYNADQNNGGQYNGGQSNAGQYNGGQNSVVQNNTGNGGYSNASQPVPPGYYSAQQDAGYNIGEGKN